jgi:hypothetical protein
MNCEQGGILNYRGMEEHREEEHLKKSPYIIKPVIAYRLNFFTGY